jgi:hypothetical protein
LTVIVAERADVPVFSCTLYEIVDSPLPLDVASLAQSAPLVACHVQFGCVTIVKRPSPPANGKLSEPGSTRYVHVGAAAASCVRLWVCPATEIAAVRGDVPSFRCTLYENDPERVPDACPLMVTHPGEPEMLAVH